MLLWGVLLKEISFPPGGDTFPMSLPLVRNGQRLTLDAPVTVIVGENGSGKSTLLEALAYACQLPMAGSADSVDTDRTLAHVRPLGEALRLSWSRRTRRGLFLRAEDFFGYVQAQNQLKADLRRQAEELSLEDSGRSEEELRRISAPFTGSVAALEERYGGDLDARSHGESFLAFFRGRLTGEGLYVLDEPEAALSPLRQLAFLSLILEAVERGAQFIIATHAPILMACPGARLYEIRGEEFAPAQFDELEHVQIMREFLAAPEAFLRHL